MSTKGVGSRSDLDKAIGPHLLDYAYNDRHRESLELILDHGGDIVAAATAAGRDKANLYRAVRSARKRAAEDGVAPECGTHRPTLEGLAVKRVSSLTDHRTGEKMMEWVISDRDKQAQIEALREAISMMVEDLEPIQPTPFEGGLYDNAEHLVNLIPIADQHFGMLSWAQETGEDFDLNIATRDFLGAVDYLVGAVPPAKVGIVANLGDLFHADNMRGMTEKSGNVLDMDGRLPKIMHAGLEAMKLTIAKALEKHEVVRVIPVQGNHDEVLSNALGIFLHHLYQDEPRVEILSSPAHRHYVREGSVLLGFTHGHETKDQQLPVLMATERPEDWGQTRHRYWYRGHHHHDNRVEYVGATVEQVRTLSAGDAYAVHHGYLSGRDLKAITIHRDYGEVGRVTCGIDIARKQGAGA